MGRQEQTTNGIPDEVLMDNIRNTTVPTPPTEVFSNNYYHIIKAASIRLLRDIHPSSIKDYNCYQMVNNETGLVEDEGFIFPQMMINANHAALSLDRLKFPGKYDATTGKLLEKKSPIAVLN